MTATPRCSQIPSLAVLALAGHAAGQSQLAELPGVEVAADHGTSVDGVDDVDGDGVADWIVGEPRASIGGTRWGRARVLSGADGSVLREYVGAADYDGMGRWVAGLADLDGDGVGEMLVSAPGQGAGTVRVLSGADGGTLRVHVGNSTSEGFGQRATALGDLDADGVDDYAIAGPYAGPQGRGRVVVYSGASGAELYTLQGWEPEAHLGFGLASAGDVDADGVDDLIVGAPDLSGAAPNGGAARVVSGADGAVLHELLGEQVWGSFGYACSGLGDLDGDGHAEFAVTAPYEGPGGDLRIYSGASGEQIHFVPGPEPNARFGWSLATPGDLDGDGAPDLLVGCPFSDGESTNGGGVFAVSGATGQRLHEFGGEVVGGQLGLSLGLGADVDGDGVREWIVGAPRGSSDHYAVGTAFVLRGGCLRATPYCGAGPNSRGMRARIASEGVTSVVDNEFHFEVTGAVPGQLGLFFYGTGETQVPFGDGLRCVSGAIFRMGPPEFVEGDGGLSRHLDFTAPPADAGPGQLVAGATRYAQFWYRDPAGPGGSGFNLSDGLRITFSP